MNRYARSIDGSVPVKALLYADEELITSQDGVGLYDGKDKSPDHQQGTCHVTTHRLFYIDTTNPHSASAVINLSNIRQTDHYAGFLTSSAKVTLVLGPPASNPSADDTASLEPEEHEAPRFFIEAWICSICGFSNPPSANEGVPKCELCGVPRANSTTTTPIAAPKPVSSRITEVGMSRSLPSSSIPTPPLPDNSLLLPGPNQEIPCPVCTFLNHPSMKICEMCSTPLRVRAKSSMASLRGSSRPSTSGVVDSVSTPVSRTNTPEPESIKISFRKGGDKALYTVLKRTLQEKAWESSSPDSKVISSSSTTGGNNRTGIHGIMQAAESTARQQTETMSESLRDLEALMSKASQMVSLAKSLNEKLTAQEETLARQRAIYPDLPSSNSSRSLPEEATFIRSSMARLGIPSMAVTQDMVKDDREYHEELAKELATVLLGERNGKARADPGGLMGSHNGIIGLDEVWGGWNRARGVALVPPSSLISVLPYLTRFTTPPVADRTFKSGLRVLHLPQYGHEAFTTRLTHHLTDSGPLASMDISRMEGMTIGLTEEMVQAVEEDGRVVRDEPVHERSGAEVAVACLSPLATTIPSYYQGIFVSATSKISLHSCPP